MPNLKVRQDQPPGIPLRSSSVPPIHLHSPEVHHPLSPATRLVSLAEQCTPTKPGKSKPDTFAWPRLPEHVRQGILAHALLPDGPGTPIAIGLPQHRAHLRTTALPIFLALGSWKAYVNAASIFYQHIHLSLSLFQDSAMTFLTSPATLRPRSLVVRIQLHFTIKDHLLLFDTGYTVSHSMGKLIKMNIPTALRSMRAHGRLREAELLILNDPQVSPENGRASAVLGYYFPMAKIQLGGWTSVAESDDLPEPAEVIVAPAFLACRAFQSGLLPLLEDGVFEKTRLALQSWSNAEEDMVRDGNSTTAHEVDRNAFVQYWLGATVLELLNISPTDETWADPFPITTQRGGEADETMADVAVLGAPRDDPEIVPSRETRYELASSPIKYSSSSSGSDTDSSSDVVINYDALRDDSQQEKEGASGRGPELSDDDTPSEDSSSSEEVVRELHKTFGATPKEHDPTDRAGTGNDRANTKDEGSSSSSDDSPRDSSPSPAAMHLEIARAGLLTTLTAAAASDDTMEVIARLTADRQLTSYGVPRGTTSKGSCKHDDTAVDCATPSDDDDDIPRTPACKVLRVISRAGSVVPDETTSGPLLAGDSTCLPGDEAGVSDTDTDTSFSTVSRGEKHGHEVSPADLSHIEDVFGARAGDETSFDVHGGLVPTNCTLASSSEKAKRHTEKDKRANTAGSVDLGIDDQASESVPAEPTIQAEAQTDTKPAKTNSSKRTAPTTPAPYSSDLNPLTSLSACPKGPVKSKRTQTKGPPNKPAKTNHTQAKKAEPAVPASNDRGSKKRKAPPAASDGPARESRSKRRKRARAAKEKQLQLAKRIEAEAAEREKTLVN